MGADMRSMPYRKQKSAKCKIAADALLIRNAADVVGIWLALDERLLAG